jgi:hypothetical protein
MSEVAIATDPYGVYRSKDFDPNYNRNNYSTYNADALGSQAYRDDLIAKDEYGQDYDVRELDLTGFKD